MTKKTKTARDRIAKRLHDLHNPGDWADHDFNGECACYVDADAVLEELTEEVRPGTGYGTCPERLPARRYVTDWDSTPWEDQDHRRNQPLSEEGQ